MGCHVAFPITSLRLRKSKSYAPHLCLTEHSPVRLLSINFTSSLTFRHSIYICIKKPQIPIFVSRQKKEETSKSHFTIKLEDTTKVKQNRGRKPESELPDSRFKGARKRKWGKWVSEIRLPNSRERIWLGSYDTAEQAARAFDAALFCLRGRSAKFNFPDNPPDIAGGGSLTHAEIQAVAARFANSVPPRTHAEEQSTSGFQTESPSPSVSVETVRVDGEWPVDDGPFLDDLTMGSGHYDSGYGLFPEFDDFSSDFTGLLSVPNIDCEEDDNLAWNLNSEPFLWNF